MAVGATSKLEDGNEQPYGELGLSLRTVSRRRFALMQADSRQTDFCTYLSAILLGGLLLNAFAGLWWADPAAGLVMVPIIAQGRRGLAGGQGVLRLIAGAAEIEKHGPSPLP
jgi:hypothetical protein